MLARLWGGGMADMVFTDPPWNVAIGTDKNPPHRQRRGLINDNLGCGFQDFFKEIAKQINNFIKEDGDIYIVMGIEQISQMHLLLLEQKLHWSATIIWVKDIFVLGRSNYHRRYEPIWYGLKRNSSFNGDRTKNDVWEIPRPKKSEEHPTMKPIALIINAIMNSSEINNIILDSFLGSGSTLIACEQTDRICYGMEIDPIYIDVILRRYHKLYPDNEIKCLNRQFDFESLFA